MKWIEVLRWASVVPAAMIGWYIALFTGIAVHSELNNFCPYGEVVSGMCSSAWFSRAEKVVIPLFVGLSALLVILMATLAAPARKCGIAKVAFAIGLIVAMILAVNLGMWAEFVAAFGSGLVASFWVCRRQRARTLAK